MFLTTWILHNKAKRPTDAFPLTSMFGRQKKIFCSDVFIVLSAFRASRPGDATGDDFRNLRTADEIRFIMAERAVEDTSFAVAAFPDDRHDRPVDPWADMTVKCRRVNFNRKKSKKVIERFARLCFPVTLMYVVKSPQASPKPFEYNEKTMGF